MGAAAQAGRVVHREHAASAIAAIPLVSKHPRAMTPLPELASHFVLKQFWFHHVESSRYIDLSWMLRADSVACGCEASVLISSGDFGFRVAIQKIEKEMSCFQRSPRGKRPRISKSKSKDREARAGEMRSDH